MEALPVVVVAVGVQAGPWSAAVLGGKTSRLTRAVASTVGVPYTSVTGGVRLCSSSVSATPAASSSITTRNTGGPGTTPVPAIGAGATPLRARLSELKTTAPTRLPNVSRIYFALLPPLFFSCGNRAGVSVCHTAKPVQQACPVSEWCSSPSHPFCGSSLRDLIHTFLFEWLRSTC